MKKRAIGNVSDSKSRLFLSCVSIAVFLCLVGAAPVHADDRLVVKHGSGLEQFVVDDVGNITMGSDTYRGTLHIYGPAGADLFSGMGSDIDNGPAFNYGYAGASFGRSAGFFNVRPDASATAPNPSLRFMTQNIQRLIITNDGNVGIGTSFSSPSTALDVQGVVNASGGFTEVSSREAKENIVELSAEEAVEAVSRLTPVKFNYKEFKEEAKVGFIAEDVPELVATKERNGMSAMDVVAVLTKVVQEQQKTIAELSAKVDELRKKVE